METVELYLNSKAARIRGDTSDCYFTLPTITTMPDEQAFISVKNAVLPYSWYNISDTNNTLLVEIASIEYTLKLSAGNYTALTLASELQNLFALGSFAFTVSYISKTNRYDFKYSNDFVFKNSGSTCFELLGLSAQDHYSLVTIGTRILQSNISINLFVNRQLLLLSDNFILSNISASASSNRNILCSIPVTGNPTSMIHYSSTAQHLIHHTTNLNALHVRIVSDDNTPINLNGCHWSACLAITFAPKNNIVP